MAKHDLINYWVSHDPEPGVHVLFRTKQCVWQGCRMCSLWKEGNKTVRYHHIIEQINTFCGERLTRVKEQLPAKKPALDYEYLPHDQISSITIGNNGSILNPDTFPPSALFHCISRLWPIVPNLKRLSLITESRYITESYLVMLKQQFSQWNKDKIHWRLEDGNTDNIHGGEEVVFERKDTIKRGNFREIEFAIGMESQNKVALEWINKNEKYPYGYVQIVELIMLFRKIPIYSKVYDPEFSIRHYVLLKPHPLTDEEAIDDVVECIKTGQKLSEEFGVNIMTHINPVYVAANSVMHEAINKGEIEYTPPTLAVIAKTLIAANDHCTQRNRFCLGLSDEGLASESDETANQEAVKADQKYTFVPEDTSDELWVALKDFSKLIGNNDSRNKAIEDLKHKLDSLPA